MYDIFDNLSRDMKAVEERLLQFKRNLDNVDSSQKKEVFLSVMLHQPLEKSEEDAKRFNFATDEGVQNMVVRATKDKSFFRKVERCVFLQNR